MTDITNEALAPFLPDGVTIRQVETKGKPIINVSCGDWQAAVDIDDDPAVTRERIIRAAWVQEHHLRNSLLQQEAREEYQKVITGLQALSDYNRNADIETAIGKVVDGK